MTNTIYTVYTRQRDGYVGHKVEMQLLSEELIPVIVNGVMGVDTKAVIAHVVEGKAPKGDLWGTPIQTYIRTEEGEIVRDDNATLTTMFGYGRKKK